MAQFTGNPTFDAEGARLFEGTWAGARGGATADDTLSDSNTTAEVRGETGFHCGRMFMTFGLSSIPVTTIESATLRINVTGETATDDNHGILHLIETSPASASALVAADFNNVTFTSFGNVSTNGATGEKTFTVNATGLSYLEADFGGDTTLGIITKKDLDNTTPTGGGNMNVATVDHGTESFRPLLTIEYVGAGGGNPIFFSSGALGVG